jgi:hypothetical protein
MVIKNDEASIQGLVLFILMLIFGAATFFYLMLPMTDGVASSITLFWAGTTDVPDAAYQSGFDNLAMLCSGPVIGMLILLMAGISYLIVALRSKFSTT